MTTASVRMPYLVDTTVKCMGNEALVAPAGGCDATAKVACPGIPGMTWLFCVPCSTRWANREMRALTPMLRSGVSAEMGSLYAYWTGRLSAALEAMLDLDGAPGDIEVARSCLNEFTEWQERSGWRGVLRAGADAVAR